MFTPLPDILLGTALQIYMQSLGMSLQIKTMGVGMALDVFYFVLEMSLEQNKKFSRDVLFQMVIIYKDKF